MAYSAVDAGLLVGPGAAHRRRADDVGGDDAGAQRVHPDAGAGATALVERLATARRRRPWSSSTAPSPALGTQPRHRRGVDDGGLARLREHARQEGVHAVDDAHEVDLDQPAPVLQRRVDDRPGVADAGVVEQQVDGPWAKTASASACTAAASVTSTWWATAPPTLARPPARARARSRSTTCTVRAARGEQAGTGERPMPEPPPVTTAVRPVRCRVVDRCPPGSGPETAGAGGDGDRHDRGRRARPCRPAISARTTRGLAEARSGRSGRSDGGRAPAGPALRRRAGPSGPASRRARSSRPGRPRC